MQAVIAYYRVSTKRQGKSGLGLEAQQQAVNSFVAANGFVLIDEFIGVDSGRRNYYKYALRSALSECKKEKAILLIAKLDRLSRSVAFISALMESKVDFKVVDNPYAEKFTLHILAAVAEKEREDNSKRTSAALAAAKLRGVELGKYGKYVLSKANRFNAELFVQKMKPVIAACRNKGLLTVRAITDELNRLKIPTYNKHRCRWHVSSVHRLLKRMSDKENH